MTIGENMTSDAEIVRIVRNIRSAEQLGGVLGEDVIDPYIATLTTQLQELSPSTPTEAQSDLYDSWQAQSRRNESVGLPAPRARGQVGEAVEVVGAYHGFWEHVSFLGSSAVGTSAAAETRGKGDAETAGASDRAGAVGTETASPESRKETKQVVIRYDDEEFRPKAQISEAYGALLTALSDAGEGRLSIAQFLKRHVGATSYQIYLAMGGNWTLPDGVDPKAARAQVFQIYGVIDRLRKRGLVEHVKGDLHARTETGSVQTGTLRALRPISVQEVDDEVRITFGEQPYAIKADLYRQTVDNGCTIIDKMEMTEPAFRRLAKTLGLIAINSLDLPEEDGRVRIKRADVVGWVTASEPEGSSEPLDFSAIMGDVRSLVADFDGEFPLSTHGRAGGGYYEWSRGARVEIIEGFPDKPRFDQVVYIEPSASAVYVHIDGQRHEMVDLDGKNVSRLLSAKGVDIPKLVQRYLALLEVLTTMTADDVLTNSDIQERLASIGDGESGDVLSNWIRVAIDKLNSTSPDEPLVNRRSHRGSYVQIDINRRMQFIEAGTVPPDTSGLVRPRAGGVGANGAGGSAAGSPERVSPRITKGGHRGLVTESVNGSGRKPERAGSSHEGQTVVELVQSSLALSDTSDGRRVRNLLLGSARHGYPATAQEAVYLLGLITNEKVIAQLREGDAFRHQTRDRLDAYVHEIVTDCFMSLFTRGDFEQITRALAVHSSDFNPESRAMLTLVSKRVRTSIAVLRQDQPEAMQPSGDKREGFIQTTLEGFLSGRVTTPSSVVQAITMLDVFAQNRREIARALSSETLAKIEATLNSHATTILGKTNYKAMMSVRTPHRVSGRAVQVSGGGEEELRRTDAYRRSDDGVYSDPVAKNQRRTRRGRRRGR